MIIGITGKARSGKDTVAETLIAVGNVNNVNFYRYAFADPIKEACRQIFGWTDEQLFGREKDIVDPKYGISPRQAFQTMGNDWGRNMIRDDLWLIVAENLCKNRKVVIPDIRYPNEYEWVKRNGGKIIHVCRTDGTRIERDNHESESHVLPIGTDDFFVNNDGSLDDLVRRVYVIFGELNATLRH